ncbi:hypothetical protein BRC70_01940 [Halobacteriales archaeon QH_6_68_27]|jgi:hypothetical protein|nr:MAG: hypothetical protein BRC70_01940 [Halobacteriales archaeon QH_6_68_27]
MAKLRSLIEERTRNAALSWVLIAVLLVVAVTDALVGQWLWVGFSGAVIAVALVPAVAARDPTVVVSWEALLLATVPIAAQVVGGFVDPLTYVSVATLSLLIAVQLVTFSETRMPPWFAVAYVIMTTMAVAAVWAIVQYYADQFLGTSFVPGRKELMWDLVGATAAGLATGLVFEFYFKRRPAKATGSVKRGGAND